eukprot:c18968_g2_i1.p1 GENE.c18968_g2_i1~~c18968_g2_i1.p1  ORF type:complete len:124 (+),score=25.49 c18968_g2_i1:41-412(+)
MTEWGGQRDEALANMTRADMDMIRIGNCQGFRQLGSAVLSLCFMASGAAGLLYGGVGGKCWYAWDYTAGKLIAEEAGCVVTDIRGESFDLFGNSILVACNRSVWSRAVEILRPHLRKQESSPD